MSVNPRFHQLESVYSSQDQYRQEVTAQDQVTLEAYQRLIHVPKVFAVPGFRGEVELKDLINLFGGNVLLIGGGVRYLVQGEELEPGYLESKDLDLLLWLDPPEGFAEDYFKRKQLLTQNNREEAQKLEEEMAGRYLPEMIQEMEKVKPLLLSLFPDRAYFDGINEVFNLSGPSPYRDILIGEGVCGLHFGDFDLTIRWNVGVEGLSFKHFSDAVFYDFYHQNFYFPHQNPDKTLRHIKQGIIEFYKAPNTSGVFSSILDLIGGAHYPNFTWLNHVQAKFREFQDPSMWEQVLKKTLSNHLPLCETTPFVDRQTEREAYLLQIALILYSFERREKEFPKQCLDTYLLGVEPFLEQNGTLDGVIEAVFHSENPRHALASIYQCKWVLPKTRPIDKTLGELDKNGATKKGVTIESKPLCLRLEIPQRGVRRVFVHLPECKVPKELPQEGIKAPLASLYEGTLHPFCEEASYSLNHLTPLEATPELLQEAISWLLKAVDLPKELLRQISILAGKSGLLCTPSLDPEGYIRGVIRSGSKERAINCLPIFSDKIDPYLILPFSQLLGEFPDSSQWVENVLGRVPVEDLQAFDRLFAPILKGDYFDKRKEREDPSLFSEEEHFLGLLEHFKSRFSAYILERGNELELSPFFAFQLFIEMASEPCAWHLLALLDLPTIREEQGSLSNPLKTLPHITSKSDFLKGVKFASSLWSVSKTKARSLIRKYLQPNAKWANLENGGLELFFKAQMVATAEMGIKELTKTPEVKEGIASLLNRYSGGYAFESKTKDFFAWSRLVSRLFDQGLDESVKQKWAVKGLELCASHEMPQFLKTLEQKGGLSQANLRGSIHALVEKGEWDAIFELLPLVKRVIETATLSVMVGGLLNKLPGGRLEDFAPFLFSHLEGIEPSENYIYYQTFLEKGGVPDEKWNTTYLKYAQEHLDFLPRINALFGYLKTEEEKLLFCRTAFRVLSKLSPSLRNEVLDYLENDPDSAKRYFCYLLREGYQERFPLFCRLLLEMEGELDSLLEKDKRGDVLESFLKENKLEEAIVLIKRCPEIPLNDLQGIPNQLKNAPSLSFVVRFLSERIKSEERAVGEPFALRLLKWDKQARIELGTYLSQSGNPQNRLQGEREVLFVYAETVQDELSYKAYATRVLSALKTLPVELREPLYSSLYNAFNYLTKPLVPLFLKNITSLNKKVTPVYLKELIASEDVSAKDKIALFKRFHPKEGPLWDDLSLSVQKTWQPQTQGGLDLFLDLVPRLTPEGREVQFLSFVHFAIESGKVLPFEVIKDHYLSNQIPRVSRKEIEQITDAAQKQEELSFEVFERFLLILCELKKHSPDEKEIPDAVFPFVSRFISKALEEGSFTLDHLGRLLSSLFNCLAVRNPFQTGREDLVHLGVFFSQEFDKSVYSESITSFLAFLTDTIVDQYGEGNKITHDFHAFLGYLSAYSFSLMQRPPATREDSRWDFIFSLAKQEKYEAAIGVIQVYRQLQEISFSMDKPLYCIREVYRSMQCFLQSNTELYYLMFDFKSYEDHGIVKEVFDHLRLLHDCFESTPYLVEKGYLSKEEGIGAILTNYYRELCLVFCMRGEIDMEEEKVYQNMILEFFTKWGLVFENAKKKGILTNPELEKGIRDFHAYLTTLVSVSFPLRNLNAVPYEKQGFTIPDFIELSEALWVEFEGCKSEVLPQNQYHINLLQVIQRVYWLMLFLNYSNDAAIKSLYPQDPDSVDEIKESLRLNNRRSAAVDDILTFTKYLLQKPNFDDYHTIGTFGKLSGTLELIGAKRGNYLFSLLAALMTKNFPAK